MDATARPKGPASYFPSIEKTYGYPVSHWFAVLDKAAGLKHGEQVALLSGEAAIDSSFHASFLHRFTWCCLGGCRASGGCSGGTRWIGF